MFKTLRTSLFMLIALTLLTGAAYPLITTLLAQSAFPNESHGSLIIQKGHVYGSCLIGQPFSGDGYFWSRPSATSPIPYNGESSGASNLSQSNPALYDAIKDRVDAVHTANPTWPGKIPADLITTSASGLDPHISPQSAQLQIDRVAKARNLDPAAIAKLIDHYTESRAFGILGEPTVNVLLLNLALDHPDWNHPVGPEPLLYRGRGFLP